MKTCPVGKDASHINSAIKLTKDGNGLLNLCIYFLAVTHINLSDDVPIARKRLESILKAGFVHVGERELGTSTC